jgi:hypothetical protein
MPFFDHLEELRWRIIWSLLALVVQARAGFFVLATRLDLLGMLKRPLDPYIDGEQLIALSITDPFFITFKLALTLGFILAAPVIVYQVWLFLAPALTKRSAPSCPRSTWASCSSASAWRGVPVRAAADGDVPGGLPDGEPQADVDGDAVLRLRDQAARGVRPGVPDAGRDPDPGVAGVGVLRSSSAKRRYAIRVITVTAALITPGDVASTILMMVPSCPAVRVEHRPDARVERGRARERSGGRGGSGSRGGNSLMSARTAMLAAFAVLMVLLPRRRRLRRSSSSPDTVLTPQERAMQRLRALGAVAGRIPPRTADDRCGHAQTGDGQAPGRGRAAIRIERDSVMNMLLGVPDYVATEYQGDTVRFEADSSRLELRGSQAQVAREGSQLVADSLIVYDERSPGRAATATPYCTPWA